MAAFPQTMPQSAYNRAIPPPTTMNAPYPMYQPAMAAPPGAMTMNMVPAGGAMPPRAGGRAPQGYYNPAAPPVNPSAPMKGTLRPGEKIRVGNHSVVIEKYLSEGGYAHVYLTHSDTPLGPNKLTTHCLKRLAFREEQAPDMMKDVEKEIEVMKALRGNPWIVEYLGSEVRRTGGAGRHGAGWEVFILMEFCAGGGIIDLLNKRLRDRLKEAEILSIFVDVCEAVAYMHSLPKPLLHRDLKIENILCHPISSNVPSGSSSISSFRYKLCDFGSTTYPSSHAPRSKREADEQAYDLNRHTTLQYRSPEMVEPLLGLPVGLPSDVWALGVLLYKLCYYTTPFEEHGPLAIVNAKYVFPSFPVYSPKLQHVIASMLIDQPARRPSVFEILNTVHRMRGTQPSRNYQQQVPTIVEPKAASTSFPSNRPSSSPSSGNLLDFTDGQSISPSPAANNYLAATIQPQRRGRPTRGHVASASGPPAGTTSSPSMTFSPNSAGNSPANLSSSPSAQSNSSRQQSISPQPQLVNDIKQFAVDFSDAFEPQGTRHAQQSSVAETRGESASFNGFENSFAPGASAGASAQKMSPLPTSKSLQPGVGNGVSNSSAGFESSFSPSTDVALSSSKTANIPATKAEHAAQASSSFAHDDDTSFETRYPTLERLHSDHSANEERQSSPLLPPHGSVAHRATDDQAKPQRGGSLQRSMPSYHQPSLTGGPLGEGHLPSGDINGGVPLPRSNQVTGTAFKLSESPSDSSPAFQQAPSFARMDSSPLASPGDTTLPDYIDLPSPRVEAAQPLPSPTLVEQLPPPKQAVENEREEASEQAPLRDLLTGDDGASLPFLSMQPNRQPLQPASGNKPPPPLATKPPSLSLNSTLASSRPTLSKAHSSMYDAEWSPVEAAKASLSAQATRSGVSRSAHGGGGTGRQFVTSPMSESRSDFLGLGSSQPPGTGSIHDASRSRSLYGRQTTAPIPGPKSSTYPIPAEKPQGPTTHSSKRDSMQQRLSVETLVSGVGALQTSSTIGSAPPHRVEKPGVGKKPEIALKPDQLKVSSRVASPFNAPSHDAMSRNRDNYSPGGAGRAFSNDTSNISQAAVNAQATTSPINTIPPNTADSTVEPPKRKVNALIAQWNQAGPPAQGTPASVLRAKPPIGSGRRL